MPVVCICQWQNCASYSAVFKEANHVLSGFYYVSCGPRNVHVRRMIEQHLSLSDGVVNRMNIYTVAYHHWPEQLIMKNKNEKRGISKLIYREEALHYGIQFVESSELPNADVSSILNNESNRMHIQSPSVSEIDVSTLIGTFYSTPTKRTVDCGVPFQFLVDAASNTIPFPMVPSKTNVKTAIDGLVPFFPSEFFNRSPGIPLHPTKMLPSTSNDPPPSNDINPPAASDFFHVDTSNDSFNTIDSYNSNPELPTLPTPIDCYVPIHFPPAPSFPSIMPDSTIDCLPTMPDSPDAVLCVKKIHEYIKRKVSQHGIGQELLTSKFSEMIRILQCIHRNFDPIVCQQGIGIELKNLYVFPCPNLQVQNETCELMTIRQRFPTEPVYCQTCTRMERNRLADVHEKRRTAPDSRVPISHLSIDATKTSSLSEKWKRKIMSALIMKVLHARSAAEHDKYKEQHTNREAKGATASSFRGELKVLTKGAHNNKVKRQKTKQ
jgi:hypothetical protein